MNLKKAIAGTTMAAVLATGMPLAAAADGAASTRNIILGGALATYLIIQHNRKVHEKYAEDASNLAASQQQANNAQAAYSSEHKAYVAQLAANADLKKEVAYQHQIVVQQQQQLASAGIHTSYASPHQAALATKAAKAAGTKAPQVATVAYGWGNI
jgi:hypothetical protein